MSHSLSAPALTVALYLCALYCSIIDQDVQVSSALVTTKSISKHLNACYPADIVPSIADLDKPGRPSVESEKRGKASSRISSIVHTSQPVAKARIVDERGLHLPHDLFLAQASSDQL